MTCHSVMMWWFVVLSVTSDDVAFVEGCWERVDHGVERVRWARDANGWTGQYEQNGPKDTRVRSTLTIRETGNSLEVSTSNIVCGWSTCLAPFVVEGALDRRVTTYRRFGTGDSALWLGYDRSRDALLFGQAEANVFTRCSS